jgi:hypothetical protein
MKCTHPKRPENLVDGKCGNCKHAKTLRKMALREKGEFRKCLNDMAGFFERGDIVIDFKNGKSLLEIEKELRAQKEKV